jgi:hypothetical protein
MNQRGRRKIIGEVRGWLGRLAVPAGFGAVLAMFLTGCAGTVSPGYVGEPYYYAEPYGYPYDYYDYGPYFGGVFIGGYPYYPYYHHEGREYHHRGIENHGGFEGRHAMAPHGAPHAGGFRGVARGGGHGSGRGRR